MWTLVLLLSSGLLAGVASTDTNVNENPSASPSALTHFFVHALLPFPELHDSNDLLCAECLAAAATADSMMANGATVEEIEEFLYMECVKFDLFPPDVCEGMLILAGEEVLYVINNTDYGYATICGWLLDGSCQSNDLQNWTLAVPGNKPVPDHPEPQQPTTAVLRILHLSDLHVDLLYDEGSAAFCSHPLCCRNAFGLPGPGEEAAGHWGALSNCDIPINTLESLIANAAATNPDLVYVTGDLPPHDVWAQDHEKNLQSINITMQILQQYFPNTPVLNAVGNHAAAPVNSFPTPAVYDEGWTIDWLYDNLADMYTPWLPEYTKDTIKRGGFFSYSPIAGLKVLSVNMNYCNRLNWWLLLDNVDPVGELQWVIDELLASEAAEEKVHILGHIPSGGGDCDHTWSHIFNTIITRFESTVRGLFFGHQHKESWQIYYDTEDTTRPVAVTYISAAGTSGDDHNPSYKVYTVDGGYTGASWLVLDMETYHMNMTLANMEGGSPDFQMRYSGQVSYNISSFTPANVDRLVVSMATDDELFRNYMRNRYNYWEEPEEMWSCDVDCRKNELCKLVSADSSNNDPCRRIEDIIDGVVAS